MAFGCVKWPFLENAERKISSEGGARWDDSYPIWIPCCLMIPFGWLFRGRVWPSCGKGTRQRDYEQQKLFQTCRATEQTKYPQTRTSPCSLRSRKEYEDNISNLSLDQSTGFRESGLNGLPLEIRQEIYGYVLGREENCLALLPFKLRAVPAQHPIAVCGDVVDASRNQSRITRDDPLFWPQRTALLRTCRRIYSEAIGLLYAQNTFLIKDPRILLTFAKCIPQPRLNSITKLVISYKPPHYGSSEFRSSFHLLWDIVVRMQRLRTLHVYIDYKISNSTISPFAESHGYWQTILPPMLELSGLTDFELDLRVLIAGSYLPPQNALPLTQDTKALIQRIEEAARRPRKTKESVCYPGSMTEPCSPGLQANC